MNFVDIFLQFWRPAFFAFTLALVFTIIAVKFFPKWGLMDKPYKYGLDRKAIPYYGGLSVFFAFLITVLLFIPITTSLKGLIFGAAMIVILGFFDDLMGLSPWFRLCIQFVAALVLIFSGIGILSISLPFWGAVDFSEPTVWGIHILSALFTIFWVIIILNTMNFVDGVSGLSSGVTFISGLTIFFLSTNPGLHENPASQLPVAAIAIILSMCALAFFIFDFPGSKILLGDTGSTFFGFTLATLAIFSGGKVATAFLVLGIPIMDMVWVIFRRILSGKKFWQGDRKHLHHRLLDVGFSERAVVLMYLAVIAIFGFGAVSLVSSQQKFFMIIALAILMVLLALALIFLPKKNR